MLAANRDEDYDRATHDAHYWSDAPHVVGGRDAVHGGSWLAVSSERFAAVTNLRGAPRTSRSRGMLVRDFVMQEMTPREHADSIAAVANEYAGFHLIVGEVGGEAMYVSPQVQQPLTPGIHAFSNAPSGEVWPKTVAAAAEMELALKMGDPVAMTLMLMQFLALPRGTDRVEHEVFIAGERYGTRASTVIVATADEILFGEQSFTRGGEPYSKNRLFRIPRTHPVSS